jgi:uncharacterized protein
MPIISNSTYIPPVWLPNGHFQTIFPSTFRKVEGVTYSRERIATPDNDFLNLDWSVAQPTDKKIKPLVILSHGLEGDSSRQYIKGMVKLFNTNGFDCLAWNFRSCGGELNQQVRFYHSGATDDLGLVVRYCLSKSYEQLYLLGFSLGGNLTLKYLGEQGEQVIPQIQKAVTFSVPLHLSSGSTKLESWDNWIYTQRFNRSLKRKVVEKAAVFPNAINLAPIPTIRTLRDFDDHYTSKLHGFADAEDYYACNSSIHFVEKIQVPTLIVNAQNDPFLSTQCFPFKIFEQHPNIWFEAPLTGGHCGFWQRDYTEFLWSELRALSFLID